MKKGEKNMGVEAKRLLKFKDEKVEFSAVGVKVLVEKELFDALEYLKNNKFDVSSIIEEGLRLLRIVQAVEKLKAEENGVSLDTNLDTNLDKKTAKNAATQDENKATQKAEGLV